MTFYACARPNHGHLIWPRCRASLQAPRAGITAFLHLRFLGPFLCSFSQQTTRRASTGTSSNSSCSSQTLVARTPRAALFVPDLEVGPSLGSFRHHLGVSYRNLLEASSAATSPPATASHACGPAWSWSDNCQGRLRVGCLPVLCVQRVAE